MCTMVLFERGYDIDSALSLIHILPVFQDRGIRRRALLAVGRQDIEPDGLSPLTRGVEILGASSDHLVCDIEDAEEPI